MSVGKSLYLPVAFFFGLHGLAVHSQTAAGEPNADARQGRAVVSRPSAEQRTSLVLAPASAIRYSGAGLAADAKPLSLASADFNEDGVPDLVAGYSTSDGGRIVIHRGNVHALWPYGDSVRGGTPPAFLQDASVITVPEAPDFLATGDFDADGHWDIVFASRGGTALYLMRGNGKGGFAEPRRFPLGGNVSALIAGEINRPDGLTDLVVGIHSATGAGILVFESPLGALKGQAEIFALPQPATALALGRLNGNAMNDLAIAAGNRLLVVHGRDRKPTSSLQERTAALPARVSQQTFPYTIEALAAGDFTGTAPGLALLGDDGNVHMLEHTVSPASELGRMASEPNFQSAMLTGKAATKNAAVASRTPSNAQKLAAIRTSLTADTGASEWTERSAVALPQGFAHVAPRLITARVAGSAQDDLIAPDAGTGRIHVLSTRSSAPGQVASAAPNIARSAEAPLPASMRVFDTLDAGGSPVAVLPMRLNQHGLSGLVTLLAGHIHPVPLAQNPPNVYIVTTTQDSLSPAPLGPPGSLRWAINSANASGAALSSIVFDIPTTDPGYDPATGVYLIQPVNNEAIGANCGVFPALPVIQTTVTIDGYTQPGASPNTLTAGDNAKIVIRIDGGMATNAGADGLQDIGSELGSTIRGLDLTGWNNPATDSTPGGVCFGAIGGAALDLYGLGDFVEGNFIGIDPAGKTGMTNATGVAIWNGPLYANLPAQIVGGTTPQARNLISYNGIGISLSTASDQTQIEGNFIGTDTTGTISIPNTRGIVLAGPSQIVGGTLPGSMNVIAGNDVNVDIESITASGGSALAPQASYDIVQGNLIGLDVTGTQSIGLTDGILVRNQVFNLTIGGTTPAARNVISGNGTGIEISEGDFNNVVEGNYIGTDVTGARALPNTGPGIIIKAIPAYIPPGDNIIGGSTPGAGNLISGNQGNGIDISGTSRGPTQTQPTYQGNTIQGNLIGTDATGTFALPNGGDGVLLSNAATNNLIGGTVTGAGNLIANNAGSGVHIDPGTALPNGGLGPEGVGNNTIGNTILSNGAAGVRINSGTANRVSQNSIFGNGALGIDLNGLGPNVNSNCNASSTGPNNLQNAPLLTAGSGSYFVTATATDPQGNTSQFSNAVASSASGNLLTLLGNLNSKPATTYAIEFFSSPAADPSGYGQGKTYLGATTVTTAASCTAPINNPVDTTQADMAVSLAYSNLNGLVIGPDLGRNLYVATVTNNGAAVGHNAVFTDALPAGLALSGAYCNLSSCQSPITSTQGTCSVSSNVITCNLGAMAAGATATITIPVSVVGTGSITNTVTVSATEADPKPLNNTASVTTTATNPAPSVDHLDPSTILAGPAQDLPLNIWGYGLLPSTTVQFNGTPIAVAGYLGNQACTQTQGPSPLYCQVIQVVIPKTLLAVAGTPTVLLTNPSPGPGGAPTPPQGGAQLTITSACIYSLTSGIGSTIGNEGTELSPLSIGGSDNVGGYNNGQLCPYPTFSSVSWATVLNQTLTTQTFNGQQSDNELVNIAVAPNSGSASRSGSVTVAGQTFNFTQAGGASCDYTLASSGGTFSAAGGTGTITETATSSSCDVFVKPYASWITIPPAAQLIQGSGSSSFTVDPNSGPTRTGEVMVGGYVYTVTQPGPSCYFTLNTTSTIIGVHGGTGSFTVTPTPSSCSWTATSSNSSQLSISSGASGTGNGTVSYAVAANNGGPQAPTITVGTASATTTFTVQQASNFACTFAIDLTPLEVPATGAAGFFTLEASFPFCRWTASSNDNNNLELNSPASGTGSQQIGYVVAPNTGGPRTLTITAGCQNFTVNQNGTAVSNPLPTIASLQPTGTTAGSGAFTLTVNGSNFIKGSVVNFNGNARSTTFISASQLTASVLAGDVSVAGTAAVTVTNPVPGGGVSAGVAFLVSAAASAPTVTVSPASSMISTTQGLVVTITVGGNPTPTGSVTLSSGSYASSANVLANGTATLAIPAGALATGSDTLTARYTPDASSSSTYTTATGSGAVTVNLAAATMPTVTVTPSPSSIATNQLLAVSVTVGGGAGSAIPTGSVVLAGGGYTSGATKLSAGAAIINVPAGVLTAGVDALTATYTPDAASTGTYISSTGSSTVTVTLPPAPGAALAPSTLIFTSIPGASSSPQTITLTNSGNAPLLVAAITLTGSNASAFVQTDTCGPSLAAGANCTIVVTFAPMSAGTFSAALSVTDNAVGSPQAVTLTSTATSATPATFVLSTSSPAETAMPGGSATYTITATAQNGTVPGTVSLTVSGVPAGLTAAFTPPTITPGNSAAAAQLTVQVPASFAALHVPPGRTPWMYAGMLPMIGLAFAGLRRRRRLTGLLVLLASTSGFAVTGCGGGFGRPAPQTYTLTITGTSASQIGTTSVTLTIQ